MLDSNSSVNDRHTYHTNDHIALLQAIKDAGDTGIAIDDLYGPYGQQSAVLEHLLSALLVDYVSLEWAGPNDQQGRVTAEAKLETTSQEQLSITTDPGLLLGLTEVAPSPS